MAKILITGATGTIGKATIKALVQSGHLFVAGVRDTNKAKQQLRLTDEQIVPFDFSDINTYASATKGVTSVLLLAPPLNTDVVALLSPFIDFLKHQSIIDVVYIGALGLEKIPSLPFHTQLIEKLNNDGFNVTVLKPSFFTSNFKNYEYENIMERGITYVVAGDGKVGFIDPFDIGEVAAKVLTEKGHSGKEYLLTGPELLSYADAAATLSEVLNKSIFYPNPSDEEYIAALQAAGAPEFIANYMIPVYSLIKNGTVSFLTDDVEKITGKKPGTLKAALERDFKI